MAAWRKKDLKVEMKKKRKERSRSTYSTSLRSHSVANNSGQVNYYSIPGECMIDKLLELPKPKEFWVIHVESSKDERGFSLRKELCKGIYQCGDLGLVPPAGASVLASHLDSPVSVIDGTSISTNRSAGTCILDLRTLKRVLVKDSDVSSEVIQLLLKKD